MKYQYNDGGRKKAGYKGSTGDCVVRAITIATQKSYKEVYDDINSLGKKERISKHRHKSNSRLGVNRVTYQKYLENLGWKWVPTMFIGSGCKVHLKENELPGGRLVVLVSKHITAVINGVIYDTANQSRQGTRCVYGYFIKGGEKMKTYLGIVDALGLESFIEFDERQERKTKREFTLFELRAKFNPQRNAVAYKIELPDADIKKIKTFMDKGEFIKAGQVITRYLDSANKTKLTEINKHLQEIYKLRGYL